MSSFSPLSTPTPEVIAYHGWGLGSNCWHTLVRSALRRGWSFQAYDRGYFPFSLFDNSPSGIPKSLDPQFSATPGPKLLLTHSYGLHLCSPHLLQQANALIILSGFAHFHPRDELAQKQSRRRVDRMIQQLEQDPMAVLQQFWVNTVAPQSWNSLWSPLSSSPYPDPVLINALALPTLLQDLRDLQNQSLSLESLRKIPRILLIHGTADTIVALDRSEALVKDLIRLGHSRVTLRAIEGAGHGLPLTHGTTCWDIIEPWWSVED